MLPPPVPPQPARMYGFLPTYNEVKETGRSVLEGVVRGGLTFGAIHLTKSLLSSYLSFQVLPGEAMRASLPARIGFIIEGALYIQTLSQAILAPARGKSLLQLSIMVAGGAYLSRYANSDDHLVRTIGKTNQFMPDIFLCSQLSGGMAPNQIIKSCFLSVTLAIAAFHLRSRCGGTLLSSIGFSALALATYWKEPGVGKPLTSREIFQVVALRSAALLSYSAKPCDYLFGISFIFFKTFGAFAGGRGGLVTPLVSDITVTVAPLLLARLRG